MKMNPGKMAIPRPVNDNPLRDEFAMEAMIILLDPSIVFRPQKLKGLGETCYLIADCMIEARKQVANA